MYATGFFPLRNPSDYKKVCSDSNSYQNIPRNRRNSLAFTEATYLQIIFSLMAETVLSLADKALAVFPCSCEGDKTQN